MSIASVSAAQAPTGCDQKSDARQLRSLRDLWRVALSVRGWLTAHNGTQISGEINVEQSAMRMPPAAQYPFLHVSCMHVHLWSPLRSRKNQVGPKAGALNCLLASLAFFSFSSVHRSTH